MMTRKQAVEGMLCVIASCIAVSAYANGRQPPEISGSSAVKAICKERSDGARLEIFRARLKTTSGSSEEFKVLIGKVSEQIAIADIHMLELPSAQIEPNGFMKAKLARKNESTTPVFVQVRSKNTDVELAGFRKDGANVTIEVARCSTIEFSSSDRSGSDSINQPSTRKLEPKR